MSLPCADALRPTPSLAAHALALADQIPRYARINTNLTTSEDLIAFLQTAAGGSFTFLPGPGPYPAPLPPRNFHLDEHIPHLLVFPLSSSPILTAPHPSYAAGHLILQDKASCFPAYVLDPSSVGGAEAIDATAAPGNKTSHLSMLLGNAGKVHAFELSPKRFELLQKMIAKAGCKNVEFGTDPRGRDFLATNPKGAEWSKVQCVLPFILSPARLLALTRWTSRPLSGTSFSTRVARAAASSTGLTS